MDGRKVREAMENPQNGEGGRHKITSDKRKK